LEFFIVAFQSGGGFTFIARRNASRGGNEHCKGGSCFVLLTLEIYGNFPLFSMPKKEFARRCQMSIFCRNRTMATLNIPEDAFPALAALVGFDDSSFGVILKAIGESKPTLTHAKFISLLDSKLPKNQLAATKDIFEAVFGLYHLKQRDSISSSDLSNLVLEAAIESDEYGSEFSGAKGKVLAKRLTELLSFDAVLGVTSKALDVMTDNERIFCTARILSDIRTVFTDKPDSAAGAVIIHNLKIGFHQDGEIQDIYFAMDDDDLEILEKAVERAKKKKNALSSILKSANVPQIET
jgi:hypothetical protein